VITADGVVIEGGVPAFRFDTAAGIQYRFVYRNEITNTGWQPVINPPDFPPPDGWSVISTGAPMTVIDTNAASRPYRFYRLNAVKP
jgi:hypothetical protein